MDKNQLLNSFFKYFWNVVAKKSFCLQGRTTTKEILCFQGWYLVICLFLAILSLVNDTILTLIMLPPLFSVLASFIQLALIPANFSICVRRLHDAGKSGHYLWLILIPLLGIFILIFYFFLPSQKENNQYGAYKTN